MRRGAEIDSGIGSLAILSRGISERRMRAASQSSHASFTPVWEQHWRAARCQRDGARLQATLFSLFANMLSFNHVRRSAASFGFPVRMSRPSSDTALIAAYPSQISVIVRRSVDT